MSKACLHVYQCGVHNVDFMPTHWLEAAKAPSGSLLALEDNSLQQSVRIRA